MRETYGSWENFGKTLDIPRTTWIGWRRRKRASLPQISHLRTLAERTSLNINWLLVGEGPMLGTHEVSTEEGQLVGLLEGYLRSAEAAEPHEARQVWARMSMYVDQETGMSGIFRAALEGVRPIYRKMLEDYREVDRAQQIVAGWTEPWARGEEVDPATWRQRVEALFAALTGRLEKQTERIHLGGTESFTLKREGARSKPEAAGAQGPEAAD